MTRPARDWDEEVMQWRHAIIETLWESQYYHGVTKENRDTVGLNPEIGHGIVRRAETIVARVARNRE